MPLASLLLMPSASGPLPSASRQEPPPCYANFCRLVSTPEEVLLDFATVPENSAVVPIAARVALTYTAAKRLEQSLEAVIERHECLFGYLEPEPTKRLVPGLHPPADDWFSV